MQTSLSFRCVHKAVCIGNDRCGPSGAIALPVLVPCLHVECFEGDRDIISTRHKTAAAVSPEQKGAVM